MAAQIVEQLFAALLADHRPIGAAVAELRAKGATVLGEPRIGAHGTPIVFVHPRDFGGVLVELMETPAGDH